MSRKVKVISLWVVALIVVLLLAFHNDNSKGVEVKPKRKSYKAVETLSITNSFTDGKEYEGINKKFNAFVQKWELTGADVAIAKDGKLIYAHGFGYANKEENITTEPYNLFRIASVSKLITATAIMKLVEDGKLGLNQKVFGEKGILNDTIFLHYKDKRVEDITVKNLLNHSGGWTPRWGDHMFIPETIAKELNKPLPVNLQDIIKFALSKKLHFQPGSRSSYSNLGYAILQLVIEKVSGKRYENYVQETIFHPMNIFDAHLAFNWDSLRYPYEVRYYEVKEAEKIESYDGTRSSVNKCRGGNDIRTLGAAGGWVISPVSLLRFTMAIDGKNDFPDIISKQSVAQMVHVEKNFQPCGWRWVMSSGKLWRSGSFPGTSALAVVRSDGYSYVFITNKSPWKGARFPYIVDRFFDRIQGDIKKLPQTDMFVKSTVKLSNIKSAS
ncbi:MAG: beta-lactamase family protein [Bacteroidales bacterium]|nr:beta-lactamase family protein [Bacteroidales bacterium]